MAAVVSIVLLGRHLKSCEVFGGTPDDAGVITWTSYGDMSIINGIGSFESLQIVPRNMSVEVSPGDSPATMNLTDKQDFSGSITEQRQSDGGEIVKAAAALHQFIGIEATYQPDGATGGALLTKMAVIGHITDSPRGVQTGKNTMTTSFDSIGYPPYEGTGSLPAYFPSG